MDELQNYRKEIDEIDRTLLELYKRRMEISEKVAFFKLREGMQIFDPVRERDKLETLSALVERDSDREAVKKLFQLLMSASRRRQEKIFEEKRGSRD